MGFNNTYSKFIENLSKYDNVDSNSAIELIKNFYRRKI